MLANNEVVDVFVDLYPTLQKIVSHRTGSAQVAQDITQDMYFRILKLADQFPTHDDARNYLIRIALNASIDHVRTEQRRAQLLKGTFELFENHMYSPEDNLHYRQKINQIDDALASLPGKSREILYMSRVEGMTHNEIAEKLGVSRSLVEKYVVKAVLLCRDVMKKK
ncbi:RNA polymerase sigma factor [Marinomonas spartinae]|uniref:RNA polymerase sigma factor n=1 Tax=Marinomonas spartinae TaxID=1792290 RepID=UPI0018F16F87|nr:RNA polymerase sigma factor [Marinomonas spartinae]MBJ7556581.1 RNA polymerase sigma factor [Marinomonas spartinae]